MPVRAVCPECGATTSLADDSPERSVECSQCGNRVAVPGAKPSNGPPRPPAKEGTAGFDVVEADDDDDSTEMDETGRPVVGRWTRQDEDDRRRARYEDDEDEDDEEEGPRRRPTRARAKDDEDEDEDERPRRSARARAADEDEDEEEEDERPRRSVRARADEDDEDDSRSRRRARSRRAEKDEEVDEPEVKAIMEEMRSTIKEMAAHVDKNGKGDAEDEDEDDDKEPRRGSRGRAAVEGEEDEDEDERAGRRSRAGGPPKRYWPSDEDEEGEEDEEDEGEDDDRPRRAARKKSGSPVLLIVGLLAFVVLGVGGGAAAYFLFFGEEPKTVVRNEDDGGPPGPAPPPTVQGGPVQARPAPVIPAGPLAVRPASLDAVKDKPVIPLPGKVTDACAGAGGRFLFLHCAAEKKLVVFDVSALAAVKEVPTSGPNTLVAAGATKLLLADREAKAVRRWDLVKMEQDKEGPLPFDGQISALSLGAESDGPALAVLTPGRSGESVGFLDVHTLGVAAVGWGARPASLPADVKVRSAANGSHWVAVAAPGAGRPQTIVLSRYANQIRWQASITSPPPYAAFSADGTTLYSPFGPTGLPARMPKAAKAPADVWVPAVHGPFCLHVRPGGGSTTDVLARDVSQPLGAISPLPPADANDPLTPDQHAFFVPDARVVVSLPPERDHITVAPFDITAALAKAGRPAVFVTSTPPTTFTPGRPFEYTVRTYATSPDLKYTLAGPPGSAVSPDGKVRWDAPANLSDERVTLVVTASVPGASASQKLDVFNAAVPAPKAPAKKPDDKAKGPIENKSPTPKVPVAVASKLVNTVPGRLPIAPAAMAGSHAEVAVPGQIRDVCVAGGGRHLILHCPARRKLVVFDVSTLKADKTVTLNADDVLFAAGMEKLVVVYPDDKVVVRYSLATYKPEVDGTLDVRQRPTAAAMGSATSGPLVLGGIPAQGNASKMHLMFVDLDTLTEVPIAKAEGDFRVTFGSAAHLRASADGRTLGAWFAQLLPSGLQIARLDGNIITGSYRAESVGHVTPGPDGQTLYTEKGLFNAKGEPLARKEPAVPAVHGGGFLTITDVPANDQGKAAGAKRISFWEAGRDAPVAKFDGLPGFDGKRDPFERDNPLPLDKRLFLVPEAGILVVIPPTADRLLVYKLDAGKGEVKKGGG